MDINLIVSPLVGAFIGGFANWLAIHMLFYPLNERKIFGIRIPFTPGLIPKERKRIAESVANTVSNYFLSKDIIVDAIVSPESENYIKELITTQIKSQKNSDKTIYEVIYAYTGKSITDGLRQHDRVVIKFVLDYLKSDENLDIFAKYVCNLISQNIDKSISELLNDEQIVAAEEAITELLYVLVNTNKARETFSQIIYNKLSSYMNDQIKVNQLLTEELFQAIKAKIIVNSDKITNILLEYITSSSVQYKLRKKLKESFNENFKLRLVSKFIDIDKLFDEMFMSIINYIEQPSTQNEIGVYAVKIIEDIGEKSINQIFDMSELNLATINTILQSFSLDKEIIRNAISYKNIIDFKTTSIRDLLQKLNINILDNEEGFIEDHLRSILDKEETKKIIIDIIDILISNSTHLPMSKLFYWADDESINMINNALIDKYRNIVKAEAPKVLNILNISKIVEDRINSFEIGEMEDIMLGVIKKDILIMRFFEAGIGFIIGLSVPLYPYISKILAGMVK